MLIYILIFVVMAIAFSMLLCCMMCMSCFGFTGTVRNIVSKYTSASYDRQFQAGPNNPINTQCFICLQEVKNQVVATCNHSYCAKCILDYAQSKRGTAIDCPACRKKILVLLRRFNPTNTTQLEMKDKICEYNMSHSQQPSVLRALTQISSLLRYFPMLLTQDGIRYLLSNPRVKFIIMMIVYTLSPFDILPQAILGPIGLLDDSVMAANIVQQLSGLLINFVRQEGGRNRRNM